MKIWLDPNSPITNFILGATVSGGDPIKAAKLVTTDERFDVSDVEQPEPAERSTSDVREAEGPVRP